MARWGGGGASLQDRLPFLFCPPRANLHPGSGKRVIGNPAVQERKGLIDKSSATTT